MAITDRLDGLDIGVAVKPACYVASTTDLTLSGEQTIDGIAVTSSQRVLVKDQTTATENGIYSCASGSWARSRDFDGARDAIPGTLVYVDRGTANGATIYGFNSSSTALEIDIGDDDIVVSDLTGAFTGASPFSLTLFPLTSAAQWRSTDGLDVRAATVALASSDIGTSAVTAAKIGSSAVTEVKIGPLAVTAAKIGSSAVETAKIAGNAVTLAKMSTGTAGTIISYSSLGSFGEVAAGTTGHVLTANAAGLPPTFQAAPGSGLWTQIGTASASSDDATVDFTWSSTYKEVILIINAAAPVTDDVEAWIRTSTDGGGSWASGISDYIYMNTGGESGGDSAWQAGSAVSAQIVITDTAAGDAVGNAANEAYSGIVYVIQPDDATWTRIVHSGFYEDAAGAFRSAQGGGLHESAVSVNGVRFLFESGNVESGEFSAYGLS